MGFGTTGGVTVLRRQCPASNRILIANCYIRNCVGFIAREHIARLRTINRCLIVTARNSRFSTLTSFAVRDQGLTDRCSQELTTQDTPS